MKTSAWLSFGFLKTLDKATARVLFVSVAALIIEARPAAAQAPDVTIDGATVTSTTATISGTVNPHGLAAGFHVVYGLTVAYGSSGYYAPIPPASSPVVVSNKLTGLSANTTYHCQLVASNSAGIGSSTDMTFTTFASLAPVVTVDGASDITSTNAKVFGTVNPNGSETGYFVQWGTTPAYGGGGPVGSLPAQIGVVAVTNMALGMSPSTTYHYRLAATNAEGTGYSGDLTLTTLEAPPPPPPPPPTVATGPTTAVTATNATITGSVNPNGSPATYYFQWGVSTAYGNVTPTVSLPGANTTSYVSEGLTGLTPATTYHYRLVATNSAGSTNGADQAFNTPGLITIDGHTFTYTATNGAVTILGYSGPGGNVTIPGAIDGLPVTALGNSAFSSPPLPSTLLTGVTIPDTITSIGDMAFYQSTSLTNIAIPDSVTNLGDSAFTFCMNLQNLTIGSGITTIRGGGDRSMYGTFMGCGSLTRIAIPDNVTNIGNGPIHLGGSLGAFYGCQSVTNVVIGKGLTFLGVGAFSYCTSLIGVYFKGDAPIPGVNMFGEDIFHVDDLATAYYLPGTTGWGTNYAGLPTALWNPQAQSGTGGFAGGTNPFGFNIAGTPGIPIVIEACTDLSTGSWVLLQSCTLTNGLIYFSDLGWTNFPARFYRIRSP